MNELAPGWIKFAFFVIIVGFLTWIPFIGLGVLWFWVVKCRKMLNEIHTRERNGDGIYFPGINLPPDPCQAGPPDRVLFQL